MKTQEREQPKETHQYKKCIPCSEMARSLFWLDHWIRKHLLIISPLTGRNPAPIPLESRPIPIVICALKKSNQGEPVTFTPQCASKIWTLSWELAHEY
jgi:hypothetical protein